MIRVLLTNLLLVAILVCPFNCWGMFENGHASATMSTAKCKCCAHVSDLEQGDRSGQHRGKTSERPDDDCRCQGCVCNGAVVAPKVAFSDLNITGVPIAFHQPLLFAASDMGNVSSTGPSSLRLLDRSCLSGRAARILYRSFLI